MGQLGLSVGDVATPLVGEGSYHLLEEGERLVDVECFTLNVACGLGIEMCYQNLNNLVKIHVNRIQCMIQFNARNKHFTRSYNVYIWSD